MLDCFYWVTTIVGYATQDVSGKKYNALGACFVGTGANGVFKLNDMIPTGWDYENDQLRILNPANSASLQRFVWLTKEEATEGGVGSQAGWYDDTEFSFEGNKEFDLGSGFITTLFSANVGFTYAGEVFDDSFTLDCAGKKYNIIPNALPRTIQLNEILPTGWDYENDQLRLLNPANSASLQRFVWLTKEEATEGGVGSQAGWYDDTEFSFEGAKEIAPGDGLITTLFSPSVLFTFPKATISE